MIIVPANTLAAGGFSVANSCRFASGDSPHMAKNQGTPSSTRIYTFSFWFKIGGIDAGDRTMFSYGADSDSQYSDTFIQSAGDGYRFRTTIDNANNYTVITNRLIRDPSAWYHAVVAVDTTQSVAANRVKIFINGVQETSLQTANYPSENFDVPGMASGKEIGIGCRLNGNSRYFDGYLAEVAFCDGQALTPTSFGEYDEDSPTIWKPKDFSGDVTFGTNGFYLDFENSANLGNDANGGTDLTETNLDATDQATDTPTNNFCTLNPIFKSGAFTSSTGAVVLSQGNCHLAEATHAVTCGTMAVTRGKYYWEVKMNGNDYAFGVLGTTPGGNAAHSYNDNTAYGIYIESSGGNTITAGSWSGSAVYTGNATYMIAIDVDNNKLWCGKDGSWTGDPAAGSGNSVTLGTHEYAPWVHCAGTAGTNTADFNFGGCSAFTISSANQDGNGYGNFEYAVPSGFFSLCTKNLAEYG